MNLTAILAASQGTICLEAELSMQFRFDPSPFSYLGTRDFEER
jgi:hypothetical protein